MAKGDPRTGGGTGYFPAIYQSAISQQAEDYDDIMSQYKDLKSNVERNSSSPYGEKVNFSSISPTFTDFIPGSDFSELRNIADTGGFSEEDIQNIRARAIAPIRSIYSSANRNLLRQKNLSGGYAPNFAAAQSKMARESSNLIGERSTSANAAIAEMVQRGKLSGATALAPLEASEAARRQSVANMNAQFANSTAAQNAQLELETARHNTSVDKAAADREDTDFNKILEAIKGQQSTYGTTPAFASTVGSQVMNAANTVNNFAPINKSSMSPSNSVKSSIREFNPNEWRLGVPKARTNYGLAG